MKHPRGAGFPVWLILWSMAIILPAGVSPALLLSAGETFPFRPGERLVFNLHWGIIPAGEAVLETLPVTVINGMPSYHFVLHVRTNSVLDMIFKVRNRIEGYADIGMTRSLLYTKNQHEGKTIRKVVVNFDWENNRAIYTNFDQQEKTVLILPGTFDPLSVLFYTRLLDMKLDSEIQCPITNGKKSIVVNATVVRRETVTVPGGIFDTLLLETEIKDFGEGSEKSSGTRIRLWVTADNRKIPVKIESKVTVGNLSAELISAS
jgi:hypothetical protein